MMKEDAECLLARSKVSGADYPPPNAASFDKERHRRTAEYRLREGVNSTKDSRAGYFKNRQDAQKANEVFILHGSNQSKFRKISDAVPPSQKGKNIDFYSLRDEMPKMHPLMPQKNKLSTSFAVDEDKIQRKRFSFPQRSLMLREKGVQRLGAGKGSNNPQHFRNWSTSNVEQMKPRTAGANFTNRHTSRNGGGDASTPSIDFVFHTAVHGPRKASDGGFFQ